MTYHYKDDVQNSAAVQARRTMITWRLADKEEYCAVMTRRPIERWSAYDGIREQIDAHRQASPASCQPVEHTVEGVPVKAAAKYTVCQKSLRLSIVFVE